mmetsp:Transcript_2807/g.17463  ORF Transcript_2807/g.17463 Transcript_2807/m.17463 type:complete len:240 (+) Transcript_2807:2293-3012(+)
MVPGFLRVVRDGKIIQVFRFHVGELSQKFGELVRGLFGSHFSHFHESPGCVFSPSGFDDVFLFFLHVFFRGMHGSSFGSRGIPFPAQHLVVVQLGGCDEVVDGLHGREMSHWTWIELQGHVVVAEEPQVVCIACRGTPMEVFQQSAFVHAERIQAVFGEQSEQPQLGVVMHLSCVRLSHPLVASFLPPPPTHAIVSFRCFDHAPKHEIEHQPADRDRRGVVPPASRLSLHLSSPSPACA